MATQQRAASVLAAAQAFGIPHHRMRALIKEGHIVPRAVGRRSICLFSEIEAYLAGLPATRSSRRARNEEACHVA